MAATDDAAVLGFGGKSGEAYEVSAWGYIFLSSAPAPSGRFDEARAVLREGLEAKPGDPFVYTLACVEALAGERDRALELLDEAVAGNERFRDYAQTDDDLASLRDDPRFPR